MSKNVIKDVVVKKSPNFATFRMSGVFGGHKPGTFEAIIYVDELMVEDALNTPNPDPSKVKIERTLQCRIVMDPVAAKTFLIWLSKHVSEYEQKYGKINLPGKLAESVKKARAPDYTA